MTFGEWLGAGGLVVLGSIGTLIVQALQRRADRRSSRQSQEAGVRRAARLIDVDLQVAEVAAETCIEKREWWYLGRPLSSEGWQQNRDVIVTALSYKDWNVVVIAVETIDHLQSSRAEYVKIHRAEIATNPELKDVLASAERLGLDIVDSGPPISDDTILRIEPMLRHLRAGRAALAPLTH